LISLESLFEQYPDAFVIQTHRDPLDFIPSLASLTRVLRGLCSEQVDPSAAARDATHFWRVALDRAADFRSNRPDLEYRFLDVKFDDITRNPMSVISTIYDRIGRSLSRESAQRMRRFLDNNPRNANGNHVYEPDEFGIDRDALAEYFSQYRAKHGLEIGKREASYC